MTGRAILDRTRDPSGLEDRPLGPVFESVFDAGDHAVHVLVVRGTPELLEEARGRATELLELWVDGEDELDRLLAPEPSPDEGAGTDAGRGSLAPESLVLDHVTRATGPAQAASDHRQLLRAVAPALVADLVARDLAEGGALGCCVRIGDHASMTGVPPRLSGWRVEIPSGSGLEAHQLMVLEGGVSSAIPGPGRSRTWVTAPTAWQAALELEHARQTSVIRSGAE